MKMRIMGNNIRRITIAALVVLVLSGLELQAQDGQWRGPDRDGKYPDTGLLKSWPEAGPTLPFEEGRSGKGIFVTYGC